MPKRATEKPGASKRFGQEASSAKEELVFKFQFHQFTSNVNASSAIMISQDYTVLLQSRLHTNIR